MIKKLEALENPRNVEGMARFGIRPKTRTLGIPIPVLRKMAREIKKTVRLPMSHELALKLWDSKIHEARILAGYIEEADKITEKQFEKWVKGFDSWDVVDQVCSSCLDKTDFCIKKIYELAERKEEFVKRTAFTLICCLTVHDKKAKDEVFLKFLPLIKKHATDERNFVKKAVNWALRQIGKRNGKLNKEAIALAKEILKESARPKGARLASPGEAAAKWIANNALVELTGPAVQARLNKK